MYLLKDKGKITVSKKIDRLINRRVLKSLLREQQDNTGATNDGSDIDMSDYKKLGFKDVDSNPKALEIENPGSENTKQIFKNSNLPERPLPDNPYYISKDYYEELIKTNKLGKSAKDLGLKLNKTELTSGDTGIKTYRKLSDNEYKIISSPFPAGVGETFNLKYEFTNEELAKLPKDLNKEKGNMFREWVNDNKTEDEIEDALEPIPSLDKTLGKSGSFTNDHFRMAYIAFKDEYDKHLKKFGTDNAPAFMGLKKAETGEGVDKDYFKFVIDDVAVAIDMDGNILQRPRGKGGSYVNERKARILNRYQLLRERRLDVNYIVNKLQKGIESGNIKGMKKIPQDLKDIVQKKAGTVKKTSKSKPTSKSTAKKSQKAVTTGPLGSLLDFISSGEGGYNSANRGTGGGKIVDSTHDARSMLNARFGIDKNLTDMTVGEIMKLQNETGDDGRRKLFAVGRYQIIPQTMRWCIANSNVTKNDVFDEKTQDQLGIALLINGKRKYLSAYLRGQKYKGKDVSLKRAALDLAQEWASVPTPFDYTDSKGKVHEKGKSYYGGANKSGHSVEQVLAAMRAVGGRAGELKDEQKQQNKSSGQKLPYVYIADSQGRSGLGLAIRKRLGNAQVGVNFFQKDGATAAGIMSEFGDSINDAVSNTENIIFTLGGNGSSRASFLARDVLLNAPESAQITWILAPPAVEPTKRTTYVNTPGKPSRQVDTFKATRAKRNREIVAGIEAVESKLGMSGRINIIDPYPWFEQNVSSSNDGVHVDKKPGEEYVATIQSEIMPKQKTMAENTYKTRNGKMIITEAQLRSIVKKILLEATEKFEDYIKDRPSGDDFRGWVNKNHADVAKKIDLDSTGDHTNTYIKSAWDELGDEYAKIKKAEDQKKKNLSTDGKYRFLKGSNPDGTYPAKPDRGLTKPYLKFIKDEQVFALDPTEPDPKKALKQAERGTGKKVEFVSESQKILFESVLKRQIVEKYVNPAKVYMDLKKGRVDDPGGVFAKNKEKIQKIATTGVTKLKTGSSKSVDPKEHTFIDEDNLPIRFKQIDMSSGAAEAEKILSAVGGTSHKTAAGAKKIAKLVLKPAVERFGKTSASLYYDGKGIPLSDAWKYIGTSETGKQRTAWSGHTLNSFIAPGHPFFEENKSLGTLGISYFWPWMIEKRKEVESDPESYIGQKIMMPFSKEEIDSRSDIELKDGVFSLNGRGAVPKGAGLKGFKAKSRKGAVSGAHMNVYSGGKLIGGNLSGTVKSISPRDGFHTIYFVMVEILPNKEERLG
jgi:hypothetical protein